MFQSKDLISKGEFPPCISVTEPQVSAMRSLTKYRTVEDKVDEANKAFPVVSKDVNIMLVGRDKQILEVLGAVSQWCRAYHERIGFNFEQPAPAPTTVAPPTPNVAR